jgi:hypothetical protein
MEACMRSVMIAGVALLAATLPSFAQNLRPASDTSTSVQQTAPALQPPTDGWPTCSSVAGAAAKLKCSLKILD